MSKTKKAFNTDTIDCTSWQTVINSLEKAVKRQRKLFKEDIPTDIFKPYGVAQIPLKLTAWRRISNGVELESNVKARWFKIWNFKDYAHWNKRDVTPYNIPHLMESIVWTSSLIIHHLNRCIAIGAVRKR